ncbi:prepilin-type N-terminal cleavage/methylation domain-containing protein [Pseudoduganella lutea]|uniref:Prepilin-type N-terminal cleavage/methylation domain-containing protein n=1 Tax=Pseudoduganella lutea TaxID=321985 RepID=A0A4P6L3R1_9BURK|nr:prepilin-type N-terminal cleavage/methylation domain-containing protein [Pseudoduganella lutea]QBE65462.1 prepilin-type N-terminal cleavage/methylation domain-containing protein [Pseudoduganella lutea]
MELRISTHKVIQDDFSITEHTMSKTFKRAAAAGFTLIELLIVVIILAILAAIAIPQFSASTVDAQLAALDTNLTSIRTSIEQYRLQHTGMVRPGIHASTGGANCAAGNGGTGEAGTLLAMQEQLQFASNAAGQTCRLAGGEYRFGPYLTRGIPAEPVSGSAAVVFTNNANAIAPAANGTGWAYNAGTGQFIVNNSANDPNGRAYSAH